MTRTWPTLLFLFLAWAACSEETPTSAPVDDGILPSPWLHIQSEGIGILRLGTPFSELHGIEWSPGPIIDGYIQSWGCAKAIGYKYGGVIACFTRDAAGVSVLDFLLMHAPYSGRTSNGIGIGTPISQIEALLAESPDYFVPDYMVICLGKRELHLSADRNNRVGFMSLSSSIDDPHYICPEHVFERD